MRYQGHFVKHSNRALMTELL